jgi:hypothetical protein
VWLSLGAIPKLAVALPVYKGEESMVALPLTLPMGWMDSVPYFCSAIKTVANISNSILMNVHIAPHPLEQLANTLPPARPNSLPPTFNAEKESVVTSPSILVPPVLQLYHKPTRFTDIFIDDYILGIQGSEHKHLQHMHHLLHAINQVFQPVDAKDSEV